MTAKNVALKKLMNTVLMGDNVYLARFLKRHGVFLDDWYYQRMTELQNKITTALNVGSSFEEKDKTNTEDPVSNAQTAVYVYVTADIEEVWNSLGVPLSTKPVSWTSKKIRRVKARATKNLKERLHKTFEELEKYAMNLEMDPTGEEHAFSYDEEIMDISKRDVFMNTETEESADAIKHDEVCGDK